MYLHLYLIISGIKKEKEEEEELSKKYSILYKIIWHLNWCRKYIRFCPIIRLKEKTIIT